MIFLLSHGETELNVQGRLQGRSQASLTDAGRSFAQDTARMISREIGTSDGVIFTSPLIRALETSETIAKELSGLRTTITDDRISEIDFGRWDGCTYDEIDAGWPGARDAGLPMRKQKKRDEALAAEADVQSNTLTSTPI